MKILYLYRFKPVESEAQKAIEKLAEALRKDNEVKEFRLYEENPDYDKLVEMIWEADKVISWW